MKKISLILLGLMAVVFITSCNKTEEATPQQGTTELSFSIQAGQAPGGFKDAPTCINENKSASYVEVTLLKQGESQTTMKTLNVFYIDGKPYTNSIKLASGTYSIKEFIMKNDNMTPNDFGDDPIVAAAVHSTAAYASLVTTPLDQSITISDFKKNVMDLELVCYDAANYTSFGFEYFKLEQTAIREQYFYGDFCIKEVKDYDGTNTPGVTSPYVTVLGGQSNILLDLPAIFQIEVLRNGTSIGTFNNNSSQVIAQPLKIQYADNLDATDNYEFKLSIMVRVGANYGYVLFHTWTFADGAKIPSGTDGVVDFALGNCVPDADLVIPPWMNLPETCAYQMVAPTYAPGIKGGYVDAALGVTGNIHDFDFKSDTYPSYCANRTVSINWIPYTMNVYSSLYKSKLPTWAQADYSKWEKMNWIINHLDWYSGYTWSDLQQAMWILEDGTWTGSAHSNVPAITVVGNKMITDANLYGANYKVPSGGWACIIFIDKFPPNGNPPQTQTMFIKVDP